MSLWTPYVQEAPLDLSIVKEERRSPAAPTAVEYPYPQYVTPYAHPVYAYPYPEYMTMPSSSAQISPVSATSACSCCEPTPSPTFHRLQTLSSPESPPTAKPHNYFADADLLANDPKYKAFEDDAMRAMAEKNGGSLLGNNPRMRRAVQTSQAVNESYRKQRERNNFAAKQSRDRRKMREIQLSLKVAYLKNEMSKLKAQLAMSVCGRCQQ